MQHLDEGTIHAWLDGALAPNEASAADAHVQSCAQCAAAVAEARGLIAASSRILGALDEVPALQESARLPWQPAASSRRSGWWWRRAGIGYAAAATVLLAAGTTLVLRNVSPDAAMQSPSVVADESVRLVEPPTAQPQRDGAASGQASNAASPPSHRLAQQTRGQEQQGTAPRTMAKAAQPPAKTEDLAVDRIVPLPGAMPRPQAPAPTPPPNVRQDARKAMADVAADLAAPTRGAVVQGRVLDAATGSPVRGALVSIDTARAVADSAGKFKLQAVPLGQQTVNVRALGFQPVRHPVAVEAKDSVDLAFALQRSTLQLDQVVTTGAAVQAQQQAKREARDQAQATREGQRRDSLVAQSQVAAPVLRLEAAGASAANVTGCYTLRAVGEKERDADRSAIASMPARIQLEAPAGARARANEAPANRARTLEGVGRAASWRFVGDSLEVAWSHDNRQHLLRFARRDGKWVSDRAIMEPCRAP